MWGRQCGRQLGECRFRPYDLTASVAWNQGRGIPFGRCEETISVAEWKICWAPVRHALTAGHCLVYSFGVFESDPFTSFMASSGCRVYAFDPGRVPPSVPRNVTFHRWGLRTKLPTLALVCRRSKRTPASRMDAQPVSTCGLMKFGLASAMRTPS